MMETTADSPRQKMGTYRTKFFALVLQGHTVRWTETLTVASWLPWRAKLTAHGVMGCPLLLLTAAAMCVLVLRLDCTRYQVAFHSSNSRLGTSYMWLISQESKDQKKPIKIGPDCCWWIKWCSSPKSEGALEPLICPSSSPNPSPRNSRKTPRAWFFAYLNLCKSGVTSLKLHCYKWESGKQGQILPPEDGTLYTKIDHQTRNIWIMYREYEFLKNESQKAGFRHLSQFRIS